MVILASLEPTALDSGLPTANGVGVPSRLGMVSPTAIALATEIKMHYTLVEYISSYLSLLNRERRT